MNFLNSLRIHAYIKSITPAAEGGWVELVLKLEHRNNIQGECHLRIWSCDAQQYFVGQELCGLPGKHGTFGGLQIHARTESISPTFAADQWVELKMMLAPRDDILGDCRFRLWPEEAMDCQVGDELFYVFRPTDPKT